MKGRIITFSRTDGIGLILAKAGKYGKTRPYPFSASNFLSSELPKVGLEVDFELSEQGQVINITRLIRGEVGLSLV